jgi:hypothetical protein
MKSKDIPRLQEAFERFSKQIGILPNEMPQLITDSKKLAEFNRELRSKNQTAGIVGSDNYGACYLDEKMIYVNINKRIRRHKTYKHVKYTDKYMSRHKATYRDYLHTLVHELVHYHFRYLKHGVKFEQRMREILKGKTFPAKQLIGKEEEEEVKA